ncbi:MAG: GGDEF domain-containing protein [Planctomycetota bacterium]
MIQHLLLPWFPIVLAAGLAGRLLGGRRGYAVGLLCGLFWLALLQASAGVTIWKDVWSSVTIISGIIAIIAVGGWAGTSRVSLERPTFQESPLSSANQWQDQSADLVTPSPRRLLEQITASFDEFDDWLRDHRPSSNPWPKFDEFIRDVLYRCCRATHVRPYRWIPQSDHLVALREPDSLGDTKPLSAKEGVMGQVLSTGRVYLAHPEGCVGQSRPMGHDPMGSPAWCFAIRRNSETLGVVAAGGLGISPNRYVEILSLVERMITHFWGMLTECCHARAAALDDPASGLYTRQAFLRQAERTLADSYHVGDPVAVAVIALEGLRELNDTGRWEVADELVRGVGTLLRQKARADDQLGRFDGSRFVLLLRRVDDQLAALITAQLMTRLRSHCGDTERWGAHISVRCGVASSGSEQPDLRTLVSNALAHWRRAREEGTSMISHSSNPSPKEVART